MGSAELPSVWSLAQARMVARGTTTPGGPFLTVDRPGRKLWVPSVPSVRNGTCFLGGIHPLPAAPGPGTLSDASPRQASSSSWRNLAERSCPGLEPQAWEGCTGPRGRQTGLLRLLGSLSIPLGGGGP